MNPLLKEVHEAEVANVQEGIRLKHLLRGIVITRDMGDGKFDVNIFVVPTATANKIDLKIDTRNFGDAGRSRFGDIGM